MGGRRQGSSGRLAGTAESSGRLAWGSVFCLLFSPKCRTSSTHISSWTTCSVHRDVGTWSLPSQSFRSPGTVDRPLLTPVMQCSRTGGTEASVARVLCSSSLCVKERVMVEGKEGESTQQILCSPLGRTSSSANIMLVTQPHFRPHNGPWVTLACAQR